MGAVCIAAAHRYGNCYICIPPRSHKPGWIFLPGCSASLQTCNSEVIGCSSGACSTIEMLPTMHRMQPTMPNMFRRSLSTKWASTALHRQRIWSQGDFQPLRQLSYDPSHREASHGVCRLLLKHSGLKASALLLGKVIRYQSISECGGVAACRPLCDRCQLLQDAGLNNCGAHLTMMLRAPRGVTSIAGAKAYAAKFAISPTIIISMPDHHNGSVKYEYPPTPARSSCVSATCFHVRGSRPATSPSHLAG